MKQLVKLNKRPRCGGREFTYALRYKGEDGKRKCETLGHTNQRKAERQRDQKEREIRMGYVEPRSKFYLAAADDLIGRARTATAQGLRRKLVHFGTHSF
jgi:hypothetical protein